MIQTLKVAIAEPSLIIRSGIVAALKRVSGFQIQSFEITISDTIEDYIKIHKPDIFIVNPTFWGLIDLEQLKKSIKHPKLKCIALLSAPTDENLLAKYDGSIGLYDSMEEIQKIIDQLYNVNRSNQDANQNNALSNREKEVLIGIVKGLTNKEIAEKLFLSTHTVISHRKNITKKLDICSVAGLTVYAIVNNLISLEDVDKKN